MTPETVKFNGFALDNIGGVSIYNHDFNKYPTFEVRQYAIPRADRTVITSKEAREKKIPVYLEACGTTRAGTEALLLLLKVSVFEINGILEVLQLGVNAQYTATCTEFNYTWLGTRAIIELVFTASDPYGKLEQTTSVIPTITTSSNTFSIQGLSATNIRPVITLTYSGITGGTSKSVTIRNANTNQGITINETFTTGDVLYIDSENMVVLLNGVPVDPDGTFPIFKPSISGIFVPTIYVTYIDTFTTRTVDGTFSFNSRI